MKFKLLITFLIIYSLGVAQHVSTESKLNSGSWYKVCVEEDGVYKMNSAFLSDLGIDVSSIDPRKIQVYGSGGGMLPQANADARYDDLYENAITVVGESDGSFDANDYVLFFGEGPHTLSLTQSGIDHQINYYSDETCYFITVGNENGRRINEKSVVGSAVATYSNFDEYVYLEEEKKNVLTSGREWFGTEFRGGYSYTFTLNTPGKVSGTSYDVDLNMMAMSKTTNTVFTPTINNKSYSNISISRGTSSSYGIKGYTSSGKYEVDDASNTLSVNISYSNNGESDAKGYFNYLTASYTRNLSFNSDQLFFQKLNTAINSTIAFQVSNANSALRTWDVTDGEDVVSLPKTLNGTQLTIKDIPTSIRRYVVFDPSKVSSPESKGVVANQNLHGLTTPNLLIVTDPLFMTQAQELAQHRRDFNGYTVAVVTAEQVYNEFSSGVQDISSIRDFLKMLYDRGSGDNQLRYALLFGDGSYDYKDREKNNNNFIPIYESRQSLNNITTFSSDDYHGFLEDNEGTWSEPNGNHTLDIGVGRLVVSTAQQAQDVVDKLINYDNLAKAQGKWRNKICFVADDGDGNLHMRDADELAVYVANNYPEYLSKKVYVDAYQKESSSSGEIAPSVNTAIDEQIDKGVLIVNYTGHGGEGGWAQESIMNNTMISKYDNMDNLPLFITATCEFGRYDDPDRYSGAENLLLKQGGGAIGLVTTTRPVYAFSNSLLAEELYEHLFEPNADNSMPAVGDILKVTKNNSVRGVNNRNFSLLGDPSMVLAYPKDEVRVTEFDGKEISGQTDTVGALQVVEVAGIIENPITGDTVDSFNGVLYATVLDKEKTMLTLDQKGEGALEYKVQSSILFDGKAEVINGEFRFQFVLPKDIDYTLGYGKISFYAVDDNLEHDANGVYNNFVVGGSANNVSQDNTPPEVEMYLNDTTFRDGGAVQEEALFIANVWDESGINTSNSGIGHEMILMLDGETDNVIVLNEFFEATENTYQGGVVTYDLSDLPEGDHYLVFRVWDTYNNPTTDTLNFRIGDPVSLSVGNNPFDEYTSVDIMQERAGEPLEVLAEVFNMSNQIVWGKRLSFDSAPATVDGIVWDGNSNLSYDLASGMYVMRLELHYPTDGTTILKSKKLVLID